VTLSDHFSYFLDIILFSLENTKIAVIGLGYVGLPLAVAFSRHFKTTGFDLDSSRVDELKNGHDRTLEIADSSLLDQANLRYTTSVEDMAECNVFIVTVPTPIDHNKNPDLAALKAASQTVGGLLKKSDVVIYESTVYPGATEDDCVPILEQASGLRFNEDFFAGYSPERINPGDKKHTLESIVKVTAGSTPEAAAFIDSLYQKIVTAGTHLTSSIKVAEAAKVIENTQRDLNIALMNELSLIFRKLDIDTLEVLEAAGTKWNFLPFRPGLVGGHCIGVDPYYLTQKAESMGYHPQVILAGRRINDGMGKYVVSELAKTMNKKGVLMSGAKVLVLGLTFKEDCPDMRNSRVFDIVEELADYGATVHAFDPWLDAASVTAKGMEMIQAPQKGTYDAIIVAVGHRQFKETGIEAIRTWGTPDTTIFDVKSVFPRDKTDARL